MNTYLLFHPKQQTHQSKRLYQKMINQKCNAKCTDYQNDEFWNDRHVPIGDVKTYRNCDSLMQNIEWINCLIGILHKVIVEIEVVFGKATNR